MLFGGAWNVREVIYCTRSAVSVDLRLLVRCELALCEATTELVVCGVELVVTCSVWPMAFRCFPQNCPITL